MNSLGQTVSGTGLLGTTEGAITSDHSVSLVASQGGANSLKDNDFSGVLDSLQQHQMEPATTADGQPIDVSIPKNTVMPLIGLPVDGASVELFGDTEGGKQLPQVGLSLPLANEELAAEEALKNPLTFSAQSASPDEALPFTTVGESASLDIEDDQGNGTPLTAASATVTEEGQVVPPAIIPGVLPKEIAGEKRVVNPAVPSHSSSILAATEAPAAVRAPAVELTAQQVASSVVESGEIFTSNTETKAVVNASQYVPLNTPLTMLGGQLAPEKLTIEAAVKGAALNVDSQALSVESPATVTTSAPIARNENYPQTPSTTLQTAVPVEVGKPGWSDSVTQRVMWMSSQNINKAEIALDPPELGPLQVRITTQGDQTTITFTSTHGVVRDALDQGLPRLRDMMENQGLNLVNVDVSGQNQQQARTDGETGQDEAGEQRHSASGSSIVDDEEFDESHQQMAIAAAPGLVDQYV